MADRRGWPRGRAARLILLLFASVSVTWALYHAQRRRALTSPDRTCVSLPLRLPDPVDGKSWTADGPLLRVVGHRGSGGTHVENTLGAFEEAAHTSGFLELDIDISRDGQVVLVHDPTLRHLTQGALDGPACVYNWSGTLSRARVTQDAARFLPAPLARLADVLAQHGNRVAYMIDVRECTGCADCDALLAKTAALLRQYRIDVPRRVIVSSKSGSILRLAKRLLADRPPFCTLSCDWRRYGWRSARHLQDALERAAADGISVQLALVRSRPRMVRRALAAACAHADEPASMAVATRGFVWTVNTQQDAEWLWCSGWRNVISDSPRHLLQVAQEAVSR